jgi:hypothetical protein
MSELPSITDMLRTIADIRADIADGSEVPIADIDRSHTRLLIERAHRLGAAGQWASMSVGSPSVRVHYVLSGVSPLYPQQPTYSGHRKWAPSCYRDISSEFRALSRRCIIVAGMHRAGTSAVTRVVNLLGADIASTLLPATPGDNNSGYWESAAVVEIHDQLLRTLGSAFDDPFPLPERWLDSSFARDAQHRLADEIRKYFDGSRVFVVKDPRIARLLPLWLDLLDKLAIEPVVVIPVRNPLESRHRSGDVTSTPCRRRNRSCYMSAVIWTPNLLAGEDGVSLSDTNSF